MNNPSMNHMMPSALNRLRIVSLAAMLLLAGCLNLPPADKAPQLLAPQPADFVPASASTWPAANWWAQFGDAQLDGLITVALQNSPNMAVVQARMAQAASEANAIAANGGVQLAVDASVSRQLYSANSYYPPPIGGSIYNSGNLMLNFSYDVDWWGRNRSMLAAALGRNAAASAETAGAAASLSAAVANSYFQWQAVSIRIQLQQQVEEQRHRLVELEARRVKAGISAGDNLTPLKADAAAPQQTMVQLETQRDQLYYQLKSLVGSEHFPQQLQARALPAAVDGLPANLPLDLLARRPDITAARERVQASLHDVDAARAAFYPDLNLSAFTGLQSLTLGQLLHSGSRTYGVTPALHLPIFDAGRLRAGLDGNRADAALAVAEYDQTVQTAVGEVNDAAVKLKGAQREHAALDTQLQARQRDLESAQRRDRAGLGDGREVVRDRLAVLALNEQELLRQQHALNAQIDLIKALGGGYQNPEPLASAANVGTTNNAN